MHIDNDQMTPPVMANEDLPNSAGADQMPQIAALAGLDGRVSFSNAQWIEYTGLSFHQSLEQGWTAALHPHQRLMVAARWVEAIQTSLPFELECRLKCGSDGMYRRFIFRALAVRDGTGTLLEWVGTFTGPLTQQSIENRPMPALLGSFQ